MLIDDTLLTADLDRLLTDWGETITFRQVSESYDSQAEQCVEAHVDTTLIALVGTTTAEPIVGAEGRDENVEISFAVKAGDLPSGEPQLTSRVVHGGAEYAILDSSLSADGLVRRLTCRRRA